MRLVSAFCLMLILGHVTALAAGSEPLFGGEAAGVFQVTSNENSMQTSSFTTQTSNHIQCPKQGCPLTPKSAKRITESSQP